MIWLMIFLPLLIVTALALYLNRKNKMGNPLICLREKTTTLNQQRLKH